MTIVDITFLIFIIFHSLIMLFDEFYFHRKRGLTKWERIGHPLDTLSTLLCFLIIIFFPMTKLYMIIFVLLAIISCALITKDEFVHAKYCSKIEHLLHAFLFICHPILLIFIFVFWSAFSKSYFSFLLHVDLNFLKSIIIFQFVSINLFLFYQIIYWNIIWKGIKYVEKISNK